MTRTKVTRELHLKVLETLKYNGICSTAKIHGISPQTVSRIKRGKSYIGYKRELANDHAPRISSVLDLLVYEDMPFTTYNYQPRKKSIFQRLRERFAR